MKEGWEEKGVFLWLIEQSAFYRYLSSIICSFFSVDDSLIDTERCIIVYMQVFGDTKIDILNFWAFPIGYSMASSIAVGYW